MKKKLAFSLILVIILIFPTFTINAQTVEKNGPWANELYFKIYYNAESEWLALKTGEIDLMGSRLPAEKILDAIADPNLKTANTPEWAYYNFDFNSQKWPTSDIHFRRALAHLVDKKSIETDILEGYGFAMDSFVPYILGDWRNPDLRTYEYSSELAISELELGGFVDIDGDGIRNDPRTGNNMEEVIFYVAIEDLELKQAGEWLAQELLNLGVPVSGEKGVSSSVCSQAVMLDPVGEWNVYTGGLIIWPEPDYLTYLYHSANFDQDCLGGWRGFNYGGFINSTFDERSDVLMSSGDYTEVKNAAYDMQEILAEQVPGIPLYGHIAVKSYNVEWTGLVNEVGTGINSWWSMLNMHPSDIPTGGVIEYGLNSDIESLNPCTSMSMNTWEVLNLVFEDSYRRNPYDPYEKWSWLAKSWEIEEWTSPTGKPGAKTIFHYIDYAKWHDGEPFTAEDAKFTYDYLIEQQIPRYAVNLMNIQKVEIIDDFSIAIYQDNARYLANEILNIPILPKHIWEDVGAGWQDYDPVAEGTLIGLGPWKFVEYVPGEYVQLVANRDYFMDPTVLREQELESLEEQLSEATAAGVEAASDIAGLNSQISKLEASTIDMLEDNTAEIQALESQISTLENDITLLGSEVSTLEGGLSSASNIGYTSIVIAVLVGTVAVYMARREM